LFHTAKIGYFIDLTVSIASLIIGDDACIIHLLTFFDQGDVVYTRVHAVGSYGHRGLANLYQAVADGATVTVGDDEFATVLCNLGIEG